MASAWGKAWGKAWGYSWGAVDDLPFTTPFRRIVLIGARTHERTISVEREVRTVITAR